MLIALIVWLVPNIGARRATSEVRQLRQQIRNLDATVERLRRTLERIEERGK